MNEEYLALELHPACKLLRDLTPEEKTTLRKSLIASKLIDPIVLYRGQLLEGKSRRGLCIEENIQLRHENFEDHPEWGTDPGAFVLAKNVARRHLDYKERYKMAVALAADHPEWSVRELASHTGISKSTAHNIVHAEPPAEVGNVQNGQSATKEERVRPGRKRGVSQPRQSKPAEVRRSETVSPPSPAPKAPELAPPPLDARARARIREAQETARQSTIDGFFKLLHEDPENLLPQTLEELTKLGPWLVKRAAQSQSPILLEVLLRPFFESCGYVWGEDLSDMYKDDQPGGFADEPEDARH